MLQRKLFFDTFVGHEFNFHIIPQLLKSNRCAGCKVIIKKLSGQTTNDNRTLGNIIFFLFYFSSISIQDENDSPPKINLPLSCVQITEFHDVKEALLEIKATDADDPSTGNGMVEFELMDGSGLGGIFKKTFEIVKI